MREFWQFLSKQSRRALVAYLVACLVTIPCLSAGSYLTSQPNTALVLAGAVLYAVLVACWFHAIAQTVLAILPHTVSPEDHPDA